MKPSKNDFNIQLFRTEMVFYSHFYINVLWNEENFINEMLKTWKKLSLKIIYFVLQIKNSPKNQQF